MVEHIIVGIVSSFAGRGKKDTTLQ
jgi:hypothetical protein